jgi:hypothetical protein
MTDDGRWEGWLEFSDLDTGAVIRSARETTQPTRDDAMYWATGLTRVYLEGALTRARAPRRRVETPQVDADPAFDAPAQPFHEPADVAPVRAVLDPFEVYAQGERVLRQELQALELDHLRAIVRAHGLEGGAGARSRAREVVIEYIIAEVRSRYPIAETPDISAR